jgi:hypothetical protein
LEDDVELCAGYRWLVPVCVVLYDIVLADDPITVRHPLPVDGDLASL